MEYASGGEMLKLIMENLKISEEKVANFL